MKSLAFLTIFSVFYSHTYALPAPPDAASAITSDTPSIASSAPSSKVKKMVNSVRNILPLVGNKGSKTLSEMDKALAEEKQLTIVQNYAESRLQDWSKTIFYHRYGLAHAQCRRLQDTDIPGWKIIDWYQLWSIWRNSKTISSHFEIKWWVVWI